jgi:phosphoribosylformimino-5-aminoimidazole carboxamide ribotide isomerase
VDLLRQANGWKFDGCIALNIGAVGTETGLDPEMLDAMRSAYHRRLFWGGGVATADDLENLAGAGFDGAIIATALHRGKVPLAWIRRGRVC